MRIAHARREEMQELHGVHRGAGSILFKSLWERPTFQTPWLFVHSAEDAPRGEGLRVRDGVETSWAV